MLLFRPDRGKTVKGSLHWTHLREKKKPGMVLYLKRRGRKRGEPGPASARTVGDLGKSIRGA